MCEDLVLSRGLSKQCKYNQLFGWSAGTVEQSMTISDQLIAFSIFSNSKHLFAPMWGFASACFDKAINWLRKLLESIFP